MATAGLLVIYSATLARGVTFWDSGEFLAAIHSLGIPHPPGTPLFVLLARVWSELLAPVTGFTVAVNMFSAVCTAVGCGMLADMFYRWTRDALAAWTAALCAGTMSTIWLNATETEVYACAFCAACLILWTANRASETREGRWVLLTVYLVALSWTLHLTALLVVPAAAWLIIKARPKYPGGISSVAIGLLGLSAVAFLSIRAWYDPAINQGNPSTLPALWDVLQRRSYDVAGFWPRRAPLWLQLGNVIQYADWQFALGMSSNPGPAWSRTPVTVVFATFGVVGCLTHRRVHRDSWRALMLFFLTTTIGVALYLNLRAGPSFGYGILPDTAMREARERDYFFVFGFTCWGLWAGYGFVTSARRILGRWPVAATLVCIIPIAGNWTAITHERRIEQRRAENDAVAMLRATPPNSVFLAVGDNDTYPLWYMQEVRRMRRDVTVIPVPMLGAPWYRAELRRRYGLLDTTNVVVWKGSAAVLGDVRIHAAALGRPVVESPVGTR